MEPLEPRSSVMAISSWWNPRNHRKGKERSCIATNGQVSLPLPFGDRRFPPGRCVRGERFPHDSKGSLQYQEGHETQEERIGGLLLIAVRMGFGDHLVAGDIEHGSTGKAEHDG